MTRQFDPAMGLQHRQYHCKPARVPAHHGPARRPEGGRRHQRLQFHQQRAGTLDAGEYGRSGAAEVAFRQEQFGRVGDLAQAEARISNTPISSVGPKRFFTARKMRNCCEPSPSKDNTASTMCSTTRGPAIWPSLVTWPTRMIAAPDFLANLISACADARTCVTVPGADLTVSVHMVWIELITIRRGTAPSDKVETISSTEVSAANCTGASARPSRSARNLTWAMASSPEM